MRKKIVCLLMLLTITTLASVNNAPVTVVNEAPMTSENKAPLANEVTITCYNAVKSQCSGNPLITASGRKIDVKKLNRGQLRYVALSRDLLKQYNYGDTVEVFIEEGHPYNGEWLVADTMNKRWSSRIDLLLSKKQKAGKWQGRIQISKKAN